MFSIQYPSILSHLGLLAYGLQPVELKAEGRFTLLIKATKEAILTARLNQQIKIYLAPDGGDTNRGLGLITAFFDDHDEPIVLFSPLWAGDALLTDLVTVLGQTSFDLYFFDEHDREMMGVRAHVQDAVRFRATLNSTRFMTCGANEVKEVLQAMVNWFGRRTADDDGRAFAISRSS